MWVWLFLVAWGLHESAVSARVGRGGGFPLSKRQETGSRHAIATCDLPHRDMPTPFYFPRNIHGAGIATRAARHLPNPGKIQRRSRARYSQKTGEGTSIPGRKTAAQDVRRIQAIFRRGDVDKKKREKIRANPLARVSHYPNLVLFPCTPPPTR